MTNAVVTLSYQGQAIQGGYSLQTDYYYYGFETWLEPGEYSLDVQVSWVDVDVRDYTVSVQGTSKVSITDEDGFANQTGGHDHTFNATQAIVNYQKAQATAAAAATTSKSKKTSKMQVSEKIPTIIENHLNDQKRNRGGFTQLEQQSDAAYQYEERNIENLRQELMKYVENENYRESLKETSDYWYYLYSGYIGQDNE